MQQIFRHWQKASFFLLFTFFLLIPNQDVKAAEKTWYTGSTYQDKITVPSIYQNMRRCGRDCEIWDGVNYNQWVATNNDGDGYFVHYTIPAGYTMNYYPGNRHNDPYYYLLANTATFHPSATFYAGTNKNSYAPGEVISMNVAAAGGNQGSNFNGWSGLLNGIFCFFLGCSSPPGIGVSASIAGAGGASCDASGGCTSTQSFLAPSTPGTHTVSLTGCYVNGNNCASSSFTITVTAPAVNGSCSTTHYNCTTGNRGATAEYPDQWQWWCNGNNGASSNKLCSEMKPVTTCTWPGGNVNWGTGCSAYVSAQTKSVGQTAGPYTNTAPGYTGSASTMCNAGGVWGITSESCVAVSSGTCGSANNTVVNDYFSLTPAQICTTGTEISTDTYSPDGYYRGIRWRCSGSPQSPECHINKSPLCGTSNGKSFVSAPNESGFGATHTLCNVGKPSAVTLVGANWNWKCSNVGSGDASCSAIKTITLPVPTTTLTKTDFCSNSNVYVDANNSSTGCWISGGGLSEWISPNHGVKPVSRTSITNYSVYCWNSTGDGPTSSITVPAHSTACGGGGGGTPTPPPTYSCTGTIPTNATMFANDDVSLNADTPYSYSATNTGTRCQYSCNGGYNWNGSSCVLPPPPTPASPIIDFSASSSSVTSGGSSTLSWSTANAVSCTASGDWSGSRGTNGNETKNNILTNKSYTLTCQNSVGVNTSKTVTVTVSACADTRTCGSEASKHCNGSTFTLDLCGSMTTCTNAGTRYCDFNWKETAPF